MGSCLEQRMGPVGMVSGGWASPHLLYPNISIGHCLFHFFDQMLPVEVYSVEIGTGVSCTYPCT